MCRAELPPGPEQLFEEGCGLFLPVQRAVGRPDGTWGKLTAAQRRTMKEVIRLWQAAADQGDAKAQFNLGQMYANGQGVAQDFKAALAWYCKAAEQGDAEAQYNLGIMYSDGRGVAQDFKAALV